MQSISKIEKPELFRANVRKQLEKILKSEKNSSNLEKGIFNYALKEAEQRKVVKKWDIPNFVLIYTSHLKSILNNLTPEIIGEIDSGNIKAHMVAFMNHQELAPQKWSALIEAKSKRDKGKFEINMEAATDTFTCRKCKGKRCTYYMQQVRCSDEPMTVFVTCIDCGNRWKTS